jgi:hypothetical protein
MRAHFPQPPGFLKKNRRILHDLPIKEPCVAVKESDRRVFWFLRRQSGRKAGKMKKHPLLTFYND